ncbi:MAG TPA: LLM class F420-dependent oxidoreductase [Acidimicrobiales bacterium]|nr:LLM class F420-dependent oxidoreductase [Acidimicrobiales bacterium]
MKIGLQIPNFSFGTPDDQMFEKVIELATAAEESAFDSVWVMDHFYQLPPLGGPTQPMLEAYTLLGAIGARTRRVRLGTLVTGVTYRNPALLAKTVTTLDLISGGRAILGIGAAWYDVEHNGLGVRYPPDGERLDRLEEAVQICRAMFRGQRPSFAGRYYRTDEAWNVPAPIQAGGPPILIGGGGEKRTLRLVAQYGDFCNITGNVETIRHKVEVLRRHCREVGRDPAEVTVSRLSTCVLTNSAPETKTTREFLRDAVGEESGYNVGQDDELLAQVEELGEAGVEYCIFNMPISDADGVRRLGAIFR